MKVVFAGTPRFAAISLEALLEAGHDIALVLTQPDRPAGRGLKPQPSAIKVLAQARGLQLWQPAALDAPVLTAVRAARPDVIVVAAYGLIVPPALLQVAPRGCLNVHASLLPRWRGAAPIQRALLAGDANSGITIMQMDAGLDTGPILLQEALPIAPAETAGTLHDKLAALGARLIVRALATQPEPHPQDESHTTYARRIDKAEASVAWRRPAQEIERQVRALDPVPGAQTRLGDRALKIWRAHVELGVIAEPGAVCAASPAGIVVACGRDGLCITELQRAGGKRLPAGEFLAGCRLAEGTVLGTADG